MFSKSLHFCRSPALCHHNPSPEEHQHLNFQKSCLHHRKSAAKIPSTSLLCCSLDLMWVSAAAAALRTHLHPSPPQLVLCSSSEKFLDDKDLRSGLHCPGRKQELLMRKQENATMNIRKRRQQPTWFGWTLTQVIALWSERAAGKVGWR